MFFRKKQKNEPENQGQKDTEKKYESGGQAQAQSEIKKRTDAAFTYETARFLEIQKSAGRGWLCAAVFGGAFVISMIALIQLVPLKEKIPYIVEVESATGTAQVLAPVGQERAVPHSELMDKHFISEYVRARETYEWGTIAGDYNKVRYLSMPAVFDPYSKMFKNEKTSPDTLYGQKNSVRIELTSITVNPQTDSAVVRYTRRVVSNVTNRPVETSYRIATIGFEYVPDYRRTEAELLVNPLGFKITSYRTDQEFSAAGLKRNPEVPVSDTNPQAGLRPEQIIVIDSDNQDEASKLPPEIRARLGQETPGK